MRSEVREKLRAACRATLGLAEKEKDVGDIVQGMLSFAIGALVGLGYTKAGIREMVDEVLEEPSVHAEARKNAQARSPS